MPNLADEIVVDPKTGAIRQAGATTPGGRWIIEFKETAEQSLYVFAKGILGLSRLTPSLHLPLANWLPGGPSRKAVLLPRDHLKTSLMLRAMGLHMAVQPKEMNIYMPGKEGASMRILLAGEKGENSQNQLRWMKLQLEGNERLRAFWPHRVWNNAHKDSPKWSETAISLPREQDYPESTFETIGVGGAITGRHYDALLKDDLVTFEAANSTVVMQQAIEWHKASRALLDNENSLEYLSGTRWANYDLYQEILDNDPSVEWVVRAAIENGKPIFPEQFSLERLQQLQGELGGRFFLLYMNTAADPSLSEFDMEDIRYYKNGIGKVITFPDDQRDLAVASQDDELPPPLPVGTPLNRETYQILSARKDFIRRGRAA